MTDDLHQVLFSSALLPIAINSLCRLHAGRTNHVCMRMTAMWQIRIHHYHYNFNVQGRQVRP